MKGYKGFDKDLKCRDFQYEVGKTYECKGEVVLCKNGFHFCEDSKNIRGYYADLTTCRYCEVEASGEIIENLIEVSSCGGGVNPRPIRR